MAEYIERAQLLKNLGYDEKRRADVLPGSTFDIILKEPAADVAEVVRCKDCVWRGREECAMFYCCNCGEQHTWETDNDFCSYGARMDKEDEQDAN